MIHLSGIAPRDSTKKSVSPNHPPVTTANSETVGEKYYTSATSAKGSIPSPKSAAFSNGDTCTLFSSSNAARSQRIVLLQASGLNPGNSKNSYGTTISFPSLFLLPTNSYVRIEKNPFTLQQTDLNPTSHGLGALPLFPLLLCIASVVAVRKELIEEWPLKRESQRSLIIPSRHLGFSDCRQY